MTSRRTLAFTLGGLSMFGPLSMDMYLPGLPALSRDLHASASAAQLTLTACLAGLALGQLLAGPLSDRFGRRRPVLAGVATYTLASLLCALAPSVTALVLLRLIQGLAGAAGIVIGRAVVRDLYAGDAAAKLFAGLMLVGGVAPIAAPILGAQLLHVTTWRGVFVVLAGLGAVLLALAVARFPESLPPERRRPDSRPVLIRDRRFVGYALCSGLIMGAMFAYIAGSPFVLQDIHGLSPQAFSAVFALNGLGIMAGTFASGRLVGRLSPERIVALGVSQAGAGAAILLAGLHSTPLTLAGFFLVVSAVGLVNPAATTLALADHAAVAGSASALLGVAQFLIGAAAAPLVGIAGSTSALPMSLTIAALVAAAGVAMRATGPARRRATQPASAA